MQKLSLDRQWPFAAYFRVPVAAYLGVQVKQLAEKNQCINLHALTKSLSNVV
jgi:hypothetical protein